MSNQNILHLTLKKKWFLMILSGEKKEEYRERKPYWAKRLYNPHSGDKKHFDIIRFTLGYARNAPKMDVEWMEFKNDTGKEEWGAEPGVKYFVLPTENIIETYNCENLLQ